ncbi:MAG: DUF481 domain-containing protein [Gemmatimonadota bacterium]
MSEAQVRLSNIAALAVLAVAAVPAVPALAQEGEDDGEKAWSNTALLTWVATGGNSTTRTLGLSDELMLKSGPSTFIFAAGAIRSEASTRMIIAVGTSTADFTVEETTTTELTAESYFARSRYERQVAPLVFVFSGLGWDRNTFAGVDNRWTVVGGVGLKVVDTEDTQFKIDIGATYVIQDDVIQAEVVDKFGGLRFGWNLSHVLTPSTSFSSTLVLDENLSTSSDVRFDLLNALAVQMSDLLALKTSLQLLWDNEPALQSLSLEFPAGTPSGFTVSTPLDKLDSVFTLGVALNL